MTTTTRRMMEKGRKEREGGEMKIEPCWPWQRQQSFARRRPFSQAFREGGQPIVERDQLLRGGRAKIKLREEKVNKEEITE